MNRWQLLLGDVRDSLRKLPEKSVQTVVTSPPYWGLRDYGVEGQIGLEPTMEEHFQNLSAVFAEVRRVLRDDGTIWVNYGDAYAQGGGKRVDKSELDAAAERARAKGYHTDAFSGSNRGWDRATGTAQGSCKPKDLLMLPARLAIRLQEDGWFLRSEIVWHKPNPMPESCRDRPTSSHEKVYLLAKSARYFYDLEAVRVPRAAPVQPNPYRANQKQAAVLQGGKNDYAPPDESTGINLRNVWTIPTEPFPDAHFATFPQELVKPCILAGTSERGACPECGAPWVRQVEVERSADNYYVTGKSQAKRDQGLVTALSGYGPAGPPVRRILGWTPGCDHGHDPVPCVVLDPFNGSGTTGVVALRHGRSYVGCELNPEYARIAEERLQRAAKGLNARRESLDQGSLFEAPGDLFGALEDDHADH